MTLMSHLLCLANRQKAQGKDPQITLTVSQQRRQAPVRPQTLDFHPTAFLSWNSPTHCSLSCASLHSRCAADRILHIQAGDAPSKLPLFGGANARLAAASQRPGKKELQDILFFTGGPVWAMDWCPSPPDADGQEAGVQYLAVRL